MAMNRATFTRSLIAAAAATSAYAAPSTAPAAPVPQANVALGDERFLSSAWRELAGRCVGVVTNQTGVTSQLETIVDAIRRNSQICLRAIYSPEHGLRGDQTAGAYVTSYVDSRTGLPVYSLYGATRRPNAAMLSGVDVLLYDIQDVGDRTYTYISTMAYLMQAAKTYGKQVWVLDRPNPIGGAIVEGPVLDPRYASFIGLYALPIRHGMTVGELARLFNEHFGIGCSLRVIEMSGYTREMMWPDTGLQWVQTSPNIPEWSTTLVYPATGLLGGAGINNGTGYTKPFKYAGAYGLDAFRLAETLNARPIPGIHFRAASWSPLEGFWRGRTLSGVELIITDARAFRAVRTAVEILLAIRQLSPQTVSLHAAALDRDWGTDQLRRGVAEGLDAESIVRQWEPQTRAFQTLRERYLLYT
ncbi:MAG: DUF1343 domain-containing protein [Candidatus Eremiobacteraeota bacterium]|nr:DUF1343 domain-containing protein [Candidatus Eremiobacteraeota bacterium]MBC5821149.1 DUF1343 domain-containing protein [Candidatus Eremiobacteraeota bacterium]